MAKEATAMTGEQPETTGRKRRAPQGPRRPSPIYVFVKTDPTTGKPAATAVFRDPRKMADHFQTAKEEGSELLVVTPE